MSGTAETTNGGAHAGIKEEDANNNRSPPLAAADDGKNGEDDNNRKDSSADDLLSHVVPPSHILSDGRFIQLPPPSISDRSAFFERAVASHRLITDADGERRSGGVSGKRRQSGDEDAASETASRDGKRRKKATTDAPFVHPLAIASARLRAKGIDELSKAINLGGLVLGGEYFGLTNVISNQSDAAAAGRGGDGRGKDGNATNDASGGGGATTTEESIIIDQRLRSKYVLQRRQVQYENASTVLSRHSRRLSSSVSVRRILDERMRTLRRRWRLVAPEHGTRTVGVVRPREVVAVDVEVYDRDRLSSSVGGATGDTSSSSLGRIARRVPRFATMELDDDYDVSTDIQRLRKQIKHVLEGLKRIDDDDDEGNASTDNMEVEHKELKEEQSSSSINGSASSLPCCKTKAEPFAIADPTLGKIDVDFDPDKVPLLTLLFEIEKPSTGFVERATLSSSFASSTDDKQQQRLPPDERVIEALQHSLFCASLFESMRAEIILPSSTSTHSNASYSQQQQQRQQKSVAWLSSEMEESFVPPPSVMVGEDATSRIGNTRLLCVIHCHEGEVKVQLDDEYSLTVKLIEAGTAAAAAANKPSNDGGEQPNGRRSSSGSASGDSGSQSPAQMKTLCRALLLHSQSLYHEYKMRMVAKDKSDLDRTKDENKTAMLGFARVKKEAKHPSPHILQSCVGLGCKFISEKKVRLVLRRISQWLEKDMKCDDKLVVEWLPLALFDSHSRLALLFRETMCLDAGIDGDTLRVSQTDEHGEFRAVGFGSAMEFEYFLKMELRRALAIRENSSF